MKIYRKRIERIIITGNMDERDKAWEYLDKNGYKEISQGPKYLGNHKFDITKFKMVGERII